MSRAEGALANARGLLATELLATELLATELPTAEDRSITGLHEAIERPRS